MLRGCAFDGDALHPDALLEPGGPGRARTITALTPLPPGADPGMPRRPGLLIPGLVNAHAHLELPAADLPPGLGLPGWVRALRARPAIAHAAVAAANAAQAIRLGTAFLVDHGNTGAAADAARDAGLAGLFLREILGVARRDLSDLPPDLRCTPHAPYSCHPDLIRACADRAARLDHRWSLHFDEDPAEAEFLLRRAGPWAAYLRDLGRDLSALPAPDRASAGWLRRVAPDLSRALLVHGCCTEAAGWAMLAGSGAAVALCPRSNLHIHGGLPDPAAIRAAGLPILLGTDSLASAPDLDPLMEVRAALACWPDLRGADALRMVTGAARALTPWAGRLAPGLAPGVLEIGGGPGEPRLSDFDRDPDPLRSLLSLPDLPRRWLIPPAILPATPQTIPALPPATEPR